MGKVPKQQWPSFGLLVLLISTTTDLFALGQQMRFRVMRPPSAGEQPSTIKGWNTPIWYPYPWMQYEYGISDEVFYKDQKCAFIKSTVDWPPGWPGGPYTFGELSQNFEAKQYRDKRMRFSAAIKSEGTDLSAALFMSVEGGCHRMLGYDDMNGRNITGSRDWDHYKVVLDVPEESDYIQFGIRVNGKGEVWISSVVFDETKDEPTADPLYASHPRNLDFSS